MIQIFRSVGILVLLRPSVRVAVRSNAMIPTVERQIPMAERQILVAEVVVALVAVRWTFHSTTAPGCISLGSCIRFAVLWELPRLEMCQRHERALLATCLIGRLDRSHVVTPPIALLALAR